jgi:antitoxin PrlF
MGIYSTMTSKGQLTVPKEIRETLGLKEGTKFSLTIENGNVVARPKNRSIMELAGILGKAPNGKSLTVEEMDEAIGEMLGEDDERIKREWNESRK